MQAHLVAAVGYCLLTSTLETLKTLLLCTTYYIFLFFAFFFFVIVAWLQVQYYLLQNPLHSFNREEDMLFSPTPNPCLTLSSTTVPEKTLNIYTYILL